MGERHGHKHCGHVGADWLVLSRCLSHSDNSRCSFWVALKTPCFDADQCADCDPVVWIMGASFVMTRMPLVSSKLRPPARWWPFLSGDARKMVQYSKLWRELFEVVQGLGIITLGLVILLILVFATAFVLHFVS